MFSVESVGVMFLHHLYRFFWEKIYINFLYYKQKHEVWTDEENEKLLNIVDRLLII
jgi:hypothetical protein